MKHLMPLLLWLITLPALCASPALPPVDEAASDESLQSFRSHLLEVVHAKDADALLTMLSPDIFLSFGGQEGLDDFKKLWSPGSESSELWPTLEFVLSHGGTLTKEEDGLTFWAPYFFSEFPDDLDPFEHVIAIDSAVPLYERPDSHSKVLGTLSYSILRVAGFESAETPAPEGWTMVQVPGGPAGYVQSERIISPLDYRICLAKKDGRWRITVFVSGD